MTVAVVRWVVGCSRGTSGPDDPRSSPPLARALPGPWSSLRNDSEILSVDATSLIVLDRRPRLRTQLDARIKREAS